MTKVRIGVVQYDPTFCQVHANIDRVDDMIRHVSPNTLDILLLPEMAFTGYMFSSREEIEPYLESEDGPTITWARKTATRLHCHTLVGFPERCKRTGKAFNSLAVVDGTGRLQTVYRKHFLYDIDKTWAEEGPEFTTFNLALSGGKGSLRVAPAICMDLNPKDFVAPFEAFEFGTFARAKRIDLVLCAMNWLASEPPLEDPTEKAEDNWEEVQGVISYWATRLGPLMGTNAVFIGCNRIGTEKGTAFTGSSCAMRLGAQPSVLEYAGKTEERFLLVEVDI